MRDAPPKLRIALDYDAGSDRWISRVTSTAEESAAFHAWPKRRDRRALPPDGPDIGADVPGGGAI